MENPSDFSATRFIEKTGLLSKKSTVSPEIFSRLIFIGFRFSKWLVNNIIQLLEAKTFYQLFNKKQLTANNHVNQKAWG
ncbi:hypothetical protein CA265_00940 [Sphingobacteriaceae bacterium GW460-11-11-14-LB5]|nr:hypothetical protein CA265_00940 [Sphingobacteriaceae bacterium GW460-11-11-14-LB5]